MDEAETVAEDVGVGGSDKDGVRSFGSHGLFLRHKDDDDDDERVAINLFLKESDCSNDDDEKGDEHDEHDYKVDDESVRHDKSV